jgi:hypothetical protein
MLAGYLPFDDDPANPEGDNINLLYKYITTTPLTFPEYVSAMARDLLRQILSIVLPVSTNIEPKPEERMTLKQVKAHTWLYPHRALFRTPISDFEAQAKESISHLSATPMGRSVSAQEPSHTSYISPSSSHLISHAGKGAASPPSPELPSLTLDPRRHTVQLEYDRPATKPEKKVLLEVPPSKPSRPDQDLSALSIPPAPALIRSATTGATSMPRPTITLDTVEERSPEKQKENRPPSESSSVSGVAARPPTARATMPHGSKPRPTSYHPPSTSGGVPMSKGRSVSGERGAPLVLPHRSSSGSSRKGYHEPSLSSPISSYQNVPGEIVKSGTPPQELAAEIRNKTPPQSTVEPAQIPAINRAKAHKRASASISMVADKVFSFFTTTNKPGSPTNSPQRQASAAHSVGSVKAKDGLVRSNTTTRKTPVLGVPAGATVLAKKKERSPSKQSVKLSTTEMGSPKITVKSTSGTFNSEAPPTQGTKLPRSRTEPHIAAPAPQVLSPVVNESPKVKPAKKLTDFAPEKGSTGAARRVMEFFRRRARGFD